MERQPQRSRFVPRLGRIGPGHQLAANRQSGRNHRQRGKSEKPADDAVVVSQALRVLPDRLDVVVGRIVIGVAGGLSRQAMVMQAVARVIVPRVIVPRAIRRPMLVQQAAGRGRDQIDRRQQSARRVEPTRGET